eukprot:3414942-Pleurochrysis_carterae.AAC.2
MPKDWSAGPSSTCVQSTLRCGVRRCVRALRNEMRWTRHFRAIAMTSWRVHESTPARSSAEDFGQRTH